MADIIKSSEKNANTLMKDFEEITTQISTDFNKAFYSPITITLGDEFQSVVKSLKDGIKVIVTFEELIIKQKKDFKLRYVLNYGEIETAINKERAYGMLGKGLTESREMLEVEKHDVRRFFIKDENSKLSMKLNLAFFIYQSFIDDWKFRDYNIVSGFLEHKDYKLVAKILKRNISLMWRRKKSLKINEYFKARELIYLLSE
jgi:hypothetical protein